MIKQSSFIRPEQENSQIQLSVLLKEQSDEAVNDASASSFQNSQISENNEFFNLMMIAGTKYNVQKNMLPNLELRHEG